VHGRLDVLTVLGIAALYVAFAKLGLALAISAHQVTAVWPPTGFAIAAVFRFGRKSAAGVFLGALLANATADEPFAVAAGIAIGNTSYGSRQGIRVYGAKNILIYGNTFFRTDNSGVYFAAKSSDGVASSGTRSPGERLTRKMLAVVPSDKWPSVVRKRASSAPARRASRRAYT